MGTTKLEEAFDLRPIDEANEKSDDQDTQEEGKKNSITPGEASAKASELIEALSASEKVDHALTVVAGLNEHDEEMNEISREALESYAELKELGMNVTDAHAGRIMEVASSMLGIALNARDAKSTRKLKTIELQLKKMRLDKESSKNGNNDDDDNSNSVEFDRNEILKRLRPKDSDE